MADNPFLKFRGKYRIPSARLEGWNYAWPGAYFITICTAGRLHLFGTVRDGQMILSSLGKIVREEWKKSFAIRQELECDAFVIMPNHIHAIVRIVDGTDGPNVLTDGPNVGTNGPIVETDGQNIVETDGQNIVETDGPNIVETDGPNIVETDGPNIVETDGRPSLRRRRQPTPPTRTKTGVAYRAPKSISSFVAGFKSAATKRINEYRGIPGEPVWQTRFHDHIIRNQQEYQRIAAYIAANPLHWVQDIYFDKEK